MPLIVPGINNTMGVEPKTMWMNKLAGKTLSDTATDTLVCHYFLDSSLQTQLTTVIQSFSKKDLPKETRIIESGSIVSKDYKPDRSVHAVLRAEDIQE